ncbi:MAG TPA: DUF5668 domain-containing protein [Candidatus Sulfotelmatobacter sp.]|nr:DUF5668 domain-containing protein [Candidatus Sulfotelmatobacter sp.]
MTSPTTPTSPPPADPAAPAVGPQPPQGPPTYGQAGWQPGWQPRHHHDNERRGAIVGGLFLVLLGLAFLAQELVPDLDIGRFWPVILVIIGAALIASSFRRSA